MSEPFRVRNAELAEASEIGKEFVEDHTEFAKIAAYEHTLAWGSRGSGKTMHVRYLEPGAIISRRAYPDAESGFRSFLERDGGFIGVYVNCREPALSREEFRVVDRVRQLESEALIIADRYLGQAICGSVARTFRKQLSFLMRDEIDQSDLCTSLRFELGDSQTLGNYLDTLANQAVGYLEQGRELWDNLLLVRQSPLRDGLAAYVKLPTLQPDVVGVFGALQKAIGTKAPFFLIFDEVNELSPAFQRAVAGLLARRSQRTVCIKVASQRHGFRTDRAAGRPAQETHDFVSVDLDALYTSNQDAYYRRVHGIAAQRLESRGGQAPPKVYFPENPTDQAMMERARAIAEARYENLPSNQRPSNRANFVKKYAPAIVFQELKPGKAGKSYAGFDNLVHLSSGIVRAFLDCASSMYSRCVESKPGEEVSSIPISIQNEVIDEYSDRFLAALQERIDSLQEGPATERRIYEDVRNLMEGLGQLFKLRLMDRESREPRIISVSLKDQPSERLRIALNLAEQDAYLHKVWYRSKRGTGKLVCYVLNRRLCPHFGLDLAGFQGRMELLSSELERALDSPADFASEVASRKKEQPAAEGDQAQSMLWEW